MFYNFKYKECTIYNTYCKQVHVSKIDDPDQYEECKHHFSG